MGGDLVTPNWEDLRQLAADTGFRVEILEKVVRLLSLLKGIRAHPFLGIRVALKGGTALNLFYVELPRLSVDIDLNYLGSPERAALDEDRGRLKQALVAVSGREGLRVERHKQEHAGDKWILRYTRAGGGGGLLQVDVNFMYRTPLWSPLKMNSLRLGGVQATGVRVLDLHELAAGKLAALLDRGAVRDLFDVAGLEGDPRVDPQKLRMAFVVYGGMSRRDWRTVRVDDVQLDVDDLRSHLVPVLRREVVPRHVDMEVWGHDLVERSRRLVGQLLPLSTGEQEFLTHLNDQGEVRPELLTEDIGLQDVIREHPGLRWKALNVRKYKGQPGR
jgi:predicted nucleotidyltransferase component of viral defense system